MKTRRAFVMGHPVSHSRSPMLHGYWLEHHGIDGSYELLDVPSAELAAFFDRFDEAGWIGGNVTVPHKGAVIPYVRHVDDAARAIGAVNTIWREEGLLVGGNTNSIGFIGNLDERLPGWDREARRAVVMGAGGATRAAAHGLRGRGLHVAICNRTPERAEAIVSHFGRGLSAHPISDIGKLLPDADLLVNATSLGMVGQPRLDIDLARLKREAIVYDLVYVPLETDLLKAAQAKGHRTVDGLGMLLHQAVDGFRHWFGKTPEVTPELRRLLEDDIRAKMHAA